MSEIDKLEDLYYQWRTKAIAVEAENAQLKVENRKLIRQLDHAYEAIRAFQYPAANDNLRVDS